MHYFVAINENNGEFFLENQTLKQIKHVLRLKTDERIVCIYKERHFLSKIKYINSVAHIYMLEKIPAANRKTPYIHLVVSLIRQSKWEWMLQKAAELGVNEITPVYSMRSVVQISEQKQEQKINRWKSILKEAVEQSRQFKIPTINPIITSYSQINTSEDSLKIFCYENENQYSLKEILDKNPKISEVLLIVGPEGGFDPLEVKEMQKLNFQSVSFGSSILRSETASLFALSVLKYLSL